VIEQVAKAVEQLRERRDVLDEQTFAPLYGVDLSKQERQRRLPRSNIMYRDSHTRSHQHNLSQLLSCEGDRYGTNDRRDRAAFESEDARDTQGRSSC
jgi:hypothetical protein